MKTKISKMALFLALLFATSCTKSFDNPGVDKEKPVSQLSGTDKENVNETIKNELNEEFAKKVCHVTSVSFATLPIGDFSSTACSMYQSNCEKNGINADGLVGLFGQCEITVGEMMTCLEGSKKTVDEYYEKYKNNTCSNPPKESPNTSSNSDFLTLLWACDSIRKKCPQFNTNTGTLPNGFTNPQEWVKKFLKDLEKGLGRPPFEFPSSEYPLPPSREASNNDAGTQLDK